MKSQTLTKYLGAIALTLLTKNALAVDINIQNGVLTEVTGTLGILVPVDERFFDGYFDIEIVDNHMVDGQVTLGGFCFTADAYDQPPKSDTCGARSPVPILATGATGYDGIPNAPGTALEQAGTDLDLATGGILEILSFSPTFSKIIRIRIELATDAEGNGIGTLEATTDDLGDATGTFTWQPVMVPVPAAAWLFGSAVLGLAGIKRRQSRG